MRQKNSLGLLEKVIRFFSSKEKNLCKIEASDDVAVELQRVLGYRFKDQSLLKHALIHRSFTNSNDKKRLQSNERLEFFGDAILNCLITEHLFKNYPEQTEGELSKSKSLLVSRKIIGEVAASINLGSYIIMGTSEKKSGGQKRSSIISNAFEAVIGAVYLDAGFDDVRTILEKFLLYDITAFLTAKENINHKSHILEMSQADGFGIPSYPLLLEQGPDHAKKFIVGVNIAGMRLGKGSGLNKKIAQQNAALHGIENYNTEKIRTHMKGSDEK